MLAHVNQFRSRIKPKDIEMEKELGIEEQEETYDFNSETEQGMKKSAYELLEE